MHRQDTLAGRTGARRRIAGLGLLALALPFSLLALPVDVPEGAEKISETTIRYIFTVGTISVAISWLAVLGIVAWKQQFATLVDLIRNGPLIKFVTVTYIVIVVVTLALLGKLSGDKVSTLLASIVGYVLGDATHRLSTGVKHGTKPGAVPDPR